MSREQDRIFIRNFVAVIAGLAGVALVLFAIASSLYEGDQEAIQQLARERAEQRLQPAGQVRLTGEPMPEVAQVDTGAAGGGDPRSGEQVAQQVCTACHSGGFMNAPAIGDEAAWQARLGKGTDTLVQHIQQGFGNMPPQSGVVSDEEARAALQYIVEERTGLSLP